MGAVARIRVPDGPQDGNPYEESCGFTPRPLARVLDTPEALASCARRVARWRGMGRDDVARSSGVPPAAVDEVLERGSGRLEDIRAVLDAIGVWPVTLPGPPSTRIGGS